MGNTTKRILAVLLSAALLLTAAGCGKDKAAADGEDPDGELTIDPNVSTVNIKAQDNLFTLGYDAASHPILRLGQRMEQR